jgi:hypothetical protein
MSSGRTTGIPYLSIDTDQAYLPDPGQLEIKAPSIFSSAGAMTQRGAASFLGTATLATFVPSAVTTASATSVFVADGELSLTSQSGTSIVLAYRSGATMYEFTNDAGSVL